jgi:hypothetical protein
MKNKTSTNFHLKFIREALEQQLETYNLKYGEELSKKVKE